MGVGAVGIAGELGLFGGGPEVWALTEMVEIVGYGLDVDNLINGDYFGAAETISEKTIEAFAIWPGIGCFGNMVDMLIALSKGYVPVIYIEYEDGTSLPLED